MPKREPPPEQRVWARMVDREWRVTLVRGEVLRPVHELSVADARSATLRLPVFFLVFLLNSFALFRGDRGTDAVIIDHNH